MICIQNSNSVRIDITFVIFANRPNIVSFVNADTIQVLITLQGNASYYISNIYYVEALVKLESQSDNNK